jgi:hypothetical protein
MPVRERRGAKQPFALTEADRKALEVGYTDHRVFCQYFWDWDPFDWQTYFIQAPQKVKLAIAGIRTGKTKAIAYGMMHYAVYHPNARLANACISSDQASIVFTDCLTFAKSPRFEKFILDTQQHPYPKIIFQNGSEIWFRSIGYEAELWRGWEFDWINVDEAGYVAREMAIKTLRGRLIGVNLAGLFSITSSPKGKGWLYEMFKKGDTGFPEYDPNYLSLRISTFMNTKLNKNDLRELLKDYSYRMIQQEFEGVFLDNEDAVFQHDDLMNLCDASDAKVQAVMRAMDSQRADNRIMFDSSDITHYEMEPERGHTYLCSWDLGKMPKKSGRNATVGLVWDITSRPYVQIAYRYAPGTSLTGQVALVKNWHEKYRNQDRSQVHTNIDATGKGDSANELLEDEERIPIEGIVYTATNKPQMIHAAQIAVERGWVRMPFIRRFIDQMEGYDLDDGNIAQDIVMAFAQASWQAKMLYDGEHRQQFHRPIASTYRRTNDRSLARFQERRSAARSGRTRDRTGGK